MNGKTTALDKDSTGVAIQAFPLTEGRVNLGPAVTEFTSANIAHCVEDGEFVLTWPSGNTDTIAAVAGDDYTIANAENIVISSGLFHIG